MQAYHNFKSVITGIALLAGSTLLPNAANADVYWDQKTSLFELLPIGHDDIVFLGNSITDGGEFNELFGMTNIKNRGIRSDVIPGVEKRLEQVTKGKPKKIFLLIGINDVSHGLTVEQLTMRYASLIKKIKTQSPDTKLYVQSVMPVNNGITKYKSLIGKEKTIRQFNDRIKKLAAEEGAVYVDLWPALADERGNLKKAYTNDGLHLTGAGYRAWRDAIGELVRE